MSIWPLPECTRLLASTPWQPCIISPISDRDKPAKTMLKIVCWNIAHKHAAWRFLLGCEADVALLQETVLPPDDVARQVEVDPAPFHDADGKRLSRAAVVKLSDRVQVEWLQPVPITEARGGDFVVSQPGAIAAAIISGPDVRPFVAASICATYEKPHRSTGKMSWNIVDASVHRIIF